MLLLLTATVGGAAAVSPTQGVQPCVLELARRGNAAPSRCGASALASAWPNEFHEPGLDLIALRLAEFLERNRWPITGMLAICVLPASLIIGLLKSRALRERDEAFRTSEARLAAGADLAGLGYYEIDFPAATCFVDARFHEICDIPAGHQQGLESIELWLARVHPADRERMSDERDKLHDGRIDRLSIEYRYLHPVDGQKWVHHLGGVSTRAASGRALRTHGVLRDITAQRRAEFDASELRAQLAHAGRVTLLGQLASALAHELSQPLSAILRNAEAAEMMLQAPAPGVEELRAIVADILSDDQRAARVIERLRSLLKRRSLDPLPIDVLDVIAVVLALVQADAAARHVRLTFCATPGLPMVLGDRVHLQQVLLNLLVNAMDAVDGSALDQRCIDVSAHQVDAKNVEVRVTDSGPGIACDCLSRLFEPFFTTKSTGMGMGLPVSKTIIEAHKGRLWAENGPSGGACFCFTVPVAGCGGRRDP